MEPGLGFRPRFDLALALGLDSIQYQVQDTK